MANIVEAVGLTKEFRDFWNRPKAKAVNDIDFQVKEGEVLGLLGPNGSGKSTTVKMLLGLLYPTAGRLTVFGTSPRSVEAKRLIGYLPEETYLYKYLTAYETLDFFASLFNLSAAERKLRTEQLLDMVGLAHARNRQVGEFSKGMARRIGLAQAMINDPSFLILDEPTSGLDPIGCREVKDLILHMKKRGKTVLVTSHLLGDVEDICDRVIILYGGKIRAQGTLQELLTVRSSNRIVTPELPESAVAEIRKIIEKNAAGGEFRIDHPRMSLEDFFLNVVKEARQEGVASSGAVSGGEIADYLSDGADQETAQEKLDRLSGIEPAKKEPVPVPEEAPVSEKAAETLDALVKEGEKPSEQEEERVRSEEELKEQAEAESRLDDILSGLGGQGEKKS